MLWQAMEHQFEAGPEGNDPAYVGFARTALEQDLEITLEEKMQGVIGDADDLSAREFLSKAQNVEREGSEAG